MCLISWWPILVLFGKNVMDIKISEKNTKQKIDIYCIAIFTSVITI